MNKQTLSELKDKPLFTLTVDEFLSLQQNAASQNRNQEEASPAKIIGVDEAVKLTGYKKSTLYRKTSTGAIPHFKRSGKILFLREELENWLLENRQETVVEALERLDNLLLDKSKKERKS
ncbi:helix-turn-helix domain-containing protein [Parabacteroides sp. OttesenSCG-928-J18]|nr:helix-turn-helix domain-containing protein [Parabacteroides sp. OttesenSCG-928-O15]MDL2244460.1 helix-turn-helix domain-containing protein [Parabacteroides sp. OttesenSCG-928-J18]